jgi:DNA-binding protein HU-beta
MTKQELIKKIAQQTGIEQSIALSVVESFMENVKESLSNKRNVYLRGFGSFIIKSRAEKVARNISKNTTITIPAHDIPAFKPCKEFMEAVKK